jgi:glycerate kinase
MKIIIAPDSFKESLAALAVAEQIKAGFYQIFPEAEYLLLPVADGGEGTVDALVASTNGIIVPARVTGPLGEQVDAFFGISGDRQTAYIEMAAASGLALVPPARRNPMATTSFGTGELIARALDNGLRHIVIGIGGSATNDCGAGMLQALGIKLLDDAGVEIGFGGEALGRVSILEAGGLNPRLVDCRLEVACDVDNPLTGPRGASRIYGPQKGATEEMIAILDAHLAHFGRVLARDLGRDVGERPGAGAAGGMGAALLALGADLRPGIEIVSELVELERALDGATLVITGEGRIDAQTVNGKTPVGVAGLAERLGVPVIAIAGSLGKDAPVVHAHGIDAVFSVVNRVCTLPEALTDAADNIRSTARNIAATIKLARRIGGNGQASS